MAPRDIGYVNAHGTGTVVNDAVECLALNEVFGAGMAPPVSSTKPVTGHCLGATPALEAIISILALRAGCLPPTANLDSVDPACDVDLISDEPRPAAVDSVLSTSLGFWGTQAALVFTR
jgi:3-oxoacyl-[acyl-carrier-protein] synthase II